MDKASVDQTSQAAVAASGSPGNAPDPKSGDKGALDGPAVTSTKDPEPSSGSPAATKSAGERKVGEATRAQALPASTSREKAEDRLSLDFIRETYGRYPEVLFGFNSNNLEDSAYDVLSVISQFCLQNPEVILVLRGYTDRTGVRAYNLKLAEFRADMVKTYLVGKGVNVEAITTMAIGPDPDGPGGATVPYDGERRKVLIDIISPTN
ncbi:MAG: OmpA family protein [Desulfosarcina sp.]|nr:OmpA family protein [Desulfosarcina sp.]